MPRVAALYRYPLKGFTPEHCTTLTVLPEGRVAGDRVLAFRFTRTGKHRGRGELFIDGRKVGEGDLPHMVPHVIETSGEGLCCGYDSGLPVTPDYRAPFRFTGRIDQVVVELDGTPNSDAEAQLRAVLTDH